MKDIDQIGQLLDMAESVSEKITDLNGRIAKIKSAVILFFTFSLFPVYLALKVGGGASIHVEIFAEVFRFLVAGFVVVMVIFLATAYRKIIHFERAKKLEIAILHDLLPMIHEYRSYLYDVENSYIDRAIIDMRLKRIEYSGRY
ncbi:hypothetical protein [Stutzerimonas kunmingensis]|uniref:hypothetical protein n=1 Tax=Stutzerimonas kunmingensis TaxID=1211807 RepID=UPI002FC65EC2